MAREEGLKPIGESLKPIIDRIKKEREEKRKKNKPIRTQPKLPGMKKGGPIRVDHPENHPDVKKMEKSIKKDRKKFKEKYPIASKIFPGNPKKDKAKAKRIADSLQTIGAEVRTKTEGSFAKGGKVKKKGAMVISIGIGKAKDYPGMKEIMKKNKKGKKKFVKGGMAFGGEKRIPGSGAAFRGTGFKGIF